MNRRAEASRRRGSCSVCRWLADSMSGQQPCDARVPRFTCRWAVMRRRFPEEDDRPGVDAGTEDAPLARVSDASLDPAVRAFVDDVFGDSTPEAYVTPTEYEQAQGAVVTPNLSPDALASNFWNQHTAARRDTLRMMIERIDVLPGEGNGATTQTGCTSPGSGKPTDGCPTSSRSTRLRRASRPPRWRTTRATAGPLESALGSPPPIQGSRGEGLCATPRLCCLLGKLPHSTGWPGGSQ